MPHLQHHVSQLFSSIQLAKYIQYLRNHNPRHPDIRLKPLQQQRTRWLERSVGIVENTEHPSPLAGRKIELIKDIIVGFLVDDGGVGDVRDVDAHYQVDEAIPGEEFAVDFVLDFLQVGATAFIVYIGFGR